MPTPRIVLLIEDTEDLAELIADVLRHRGHEVHAVGTGAAALARLGSGGVDLILLDLTLPDVTGVELLDQLGRDPILAAIPVVLISGAVDAHLVAEQRGLAVLRKPFNAAELVRVVEVTSSARPAPR